MFEFIKDRLAAVTHSNVARFTLPSVVYEIQPGFVAGARIDGSGRQKRRIRGISVQPIKAETVGPHLSHANVADAADLRRATDAVLAAVGNGGGRFGLIVPDGAVRVAILTFEALPDDPLEAEALIRWRLKDKLPYNPEEARATFQVLSRELEHIEVLAAAVRTSVLAEYESAFSSVNGGAALILPSTVALLPLLSETEMRGQLLLHVCSNWLTAVVVAGSRPCVWRTRELDANDLESHAREAASEATRVLASARDRLQADLGRAVLSMRPLPGRELAAAVSSAIGHTVDLISTSSELTGLLNADDRVVFDQFGAALAGVAANVG